MKRVILFTVAAVLGGVLTAMVVAKQLKSRQASELAAQRSVWAQEKADLEAALENAKGPEHVVVTTSPAVAPQTNAKPTPAELIARLRSLKSAPAPRAARQAIHTFEELLYAGPAALPAIKECLARNEDFDFAAAGNSSRGNRGGVADEFVLPPSLRFGLFDVVKQIGGENAEKLLAESLSTTGRGVELAWLARALQASAPNKYREEALSAAKSLLANSAALNSTSALDQGHREQLFSVLAMFGDTSYAAVAQSQLVQADGSVDRSALRYLQQTLGQQSVAVAVQTWNDARLTDVTKKEPLARLALNYVGADSQANEFYQKAIGDMNLTPGQRRNLIEDLNQDGFTDLKNLGARDLPLIENRMALIEQLAPKETDPVNIEAFKEAYKDLVNMHKRATQPPTPPR